MVKMAKAQTWNLEVWFEGRSYFVTVKVHPEAHGGGIDVMLARMRPETWIGVQKGRDGVLVA